MLVSAMATDEHDLSPADDVDDNNGNVSAETTRPAGKLGFKASPWVIAKAHQKVKSKNTSSSKGASKHGGGGKAPKKKATRARLDGEQETVEVDEDAADLAQPGDDESHADIGHHPQSVADELAEESKKAKDTLRMTAHSVYVLPSIV